MKRLMMAELLKWKGEADRKPLILKGVRQAGKTHLLKEFGRLHFPKTHYLNFEKQPALAKIFEADLDPKRILKDLSLVLTTSIDVHHDLVIFDEIQEAPKALTSLKYFAEECPQLHLCSAGSLLGLQLNSGSFPVGKVTFRTLRPMSFEEFVMASGDDRFLEYTKGPLPEIVHDRLWNLLLHYFVVGGLPEAVLTYCKHKEHPFEAFSEVRKKQEDLLKTYFADISKHSGKVNAMHIDRTFRAAAAQLNQTHDGGVARFKFRGVIPGVNHYDRLASAIDWLENAGLVIKVHIVNQAQLPLKAYSKENFFKLLIFDVGILGCMSDLPPQTILDYDYGSYKGYFAENYVAEELLSKGLDQLFCWQEGKSEIEFVTEAAGKIIPIEVKSGAVAKAKSLQAFAEKYQPPYQIIISAKPLPALQTFTHYYPLYMVRSHG